MLSYDSQFRLAILSNAISYYDVNLSKDLIETDILHKKPDGTISSSLQRIRMTYPCKFSDFINKWVSTMVSKENQEKYPFLKDVRKTLLDYYNDGKREYIVNYWADTDNGRHIYLNQSFLLTKDNNGDIWALSIVKDHTSIQINEEEIRRKELEQHMNEVYTRNKPFIDFLESIEIDVDMLPPNVFVVSEEKTGIYSQLNAEQMDILIKKTALFIQMQLL